VLGGLNGQVGISSIVYRAQVLGGGALGAWDEVTPLPRNCLYHGAVSVEDRIYVLGGWDYDGTNLFISDRVHYTVVAPDGSPGPWLETTPMPQPSLGHAAIALPGAVTVTGGWNGATDSAAVVRAMIQPNGSLGAWSALIPMPEARYGHAAVTAGALYVLGGYVDLGSNVDDGVYGAPILGGSMVGIWTALTPLTSPVGQHAAVRYGARVFALGGFGGSSPTVTSGVYSAVLDSNGGLSSWNPEPSLPQPLFDHDAVVVGDHVYLIGGDHGDFVPRPEVFSLDLSACTQDVYVDASYTGSETGSPAQPFDTIVEGLAAVCDAGTLWIEAGTYDEPAPLAITQPVALRTLNGSVSIR
jgi:hypothetical protein